jgi:4-hydroxy-2-oxoglutarate aldolase
VSEAAELACHAARLGYHAISSRAPHHYAGLLSADDSRSLFFRALADRSPLPVIISHDHPLSSIIKLSQHPNITGAIATAQLGDLVAAARPGFQVLTGSAPHLWDALEAGAHGAVLSFAAAAPYAAIATWEAFRTREAEAGLDWQKRISHPAVLISEVFGPAGLKHAMDLNGYYGGPPRLPLVPLSTEARAEIAQAFEGFSGKT